MKNCFAIPPYLKSLGVETLILGNRGQGAIEAIAASGLKEVPGITGSADEAAELFAKGELKPNFEAKCDHHPDTNDPDSQETLDEQDGQFPEGMFRFEKRIKN